MDAHSVKVCENEYSLCKRLWGWSRAMNVTLKLCNEKWETRNTLQYWERWEWVPIGETQLLGYLCLVVDVKVRLHWYKHADRGLLFMGWKWSVGLNGRHQNSIIVINFMGCGKGVKTAQERLELSRRGWNIAGWIIPVRMCKEKGLVPRVCSWLGLPACMETPRRDGAVFAHVCYWCTC